MIRSNDEKYYSNIRNALVARAAAVKVDAERNLQNLGVLSEEFYREFVNILLDLRLVNANDAEHNSPGIDLIDYENRVVVQVSATCSAKKIQKSLDGIDLPEGTCWHFVFVAITDKAPNYAKTFKLPRGIVFDKKKDVFDTARLMKRVEYAGIDKQMALSMLVDKYMKSTESVLKGIPAREKQICSLEGKKLTQWIKTRIDELKSEEFLYQNLNTNLFVDEFLAQETETIAIIRIEKNYHNNVLLYAEAVRLSSTRSVVFFKSFEEAKNVLSLRQDLPSIIGKDGNGIIIIDRLQHANEVIELLKLSDHFGKCKIITSAYEWMLRGISIHAFSTTIHVPDIKEVEFLVNSVCLSEGYPSSSIMLDWFMQPLYEQLRTPIFTSLIIRQMRGTNMSPAESNNSLLLFDILDDYFDATSDEFGSAIKAAAQICFEKKVNSFYMEDLEFSTSVLTSLEALGVWGRKRNTFYFLCEDYLFFKIAESVLEKHGPAGIEMLISTKREKSVPFMLSMIEHRYQIKPDFSLLYDVDKKTIKRTIDLFLNSPFLVEILSVPGAFSIFEELLYRYIDHGHYETARMALVNVCRQDPRLNQNKSIIQLKMVADYYCTGVFSDCKNTSSVLYWLYKGILMYISDNYHEAEIACKKALSMTTNENIISKVIINYIDVLLDSGKQRLIAPLLERFNKLLDGIQNFEAYYISLGVAAFAQLEFEDAYHYLAEARDKMQAYYNASAMARIYGETGLMDYYCGRLNEAEENFKKNEQICLDSENANGIAISRQYIALKELFAGNYKKAYDYLSGALFYAEKAQNKWRSVQIHFMLDAFLPSFPDLVPKHISIIQSAIPSPQFHSDCYVWLLECMLRTGCNMEQINDVIQRADYANEKTDCLLNQSIIQIYKHTLSGEAFSVYHELNNYREFAGKMVADYEGGRRIPCFSAPLSFSKFAEIESQRLLFQHISKRHATGIHQYASRPQPTKYVLWKRHKTIVETFEYIKHIYHQETTGTYLLWVIVEKATNRVIGTIDLEYDNKEDAVEFGIILSDYYWGRRYGSEALSRICDYCKSVVKATRIIGVCVKGNRNSERLMKNNGFTFVNEIDNYHSIPSLPDKSGVVFHKKL